MLECSGFGHTFRQHLQKSLPECLAAAAPRRAAGVTCDSGIALRRAAQYSNWTAARVAMMGRMCSAMMAWCVGSSR